MAFDGITVAAIVQELKEALCQGRIAKIAQPEADELLLTIKTPAGQKRLYLSASASLPLIYLTEDNKPSPMTAPNFCMLLRKHIGNGRIVDISQPGLERIIRLDIEHLDELGDLCRKKLMVEIMGKHSNIIFCDTEDKIIDSIKHVSAQMSSVREVLPGRTYFIPDTMDKEDPLTVDKDRFIQTLLAKAAALGKALYTGFTGISPAAAEEICALAGIDSSLPARELSPDVLTHLYRQFSYYMEDIRKGAFHPVIYYDGKMPKDFSVTSHDPLQRLYHPGVFFCFPDAGHLLCLPQRPHPDPAEKRGSAAHRPHSSGAEPEEIRPPVPPAQRHRRPGSVPGLRRADQHLRLQPPGGAEELTALNYYDGKEITIPLDPARTPQENAQRYFSRYNKLKRTYEALSQLIQETGEEISYLESVANALEIAENEDDLSQIKDELAGSGYIRRRPGQKKKKITSRPLHYISSDGYDMYVGKNNLQNDELTFSFASGNDWWFHAKGAPGSHVIVKTGGDELPDRTFEEAGRLAAYYSKNRGGDKVEIDYVEKKHVKKPNGAKPGFVVYYTNYSLVIDSDISQIKEAPER